MPPKRSTWFVKDVTSQQFYLTAIGRVELGDIARKTGLRHLGALTAADLENLLAEHWLANCSPVLRQVVDGDF